MVYNFDKNIDKNGQFAELREVGVRWWNSTPLKHCICKNYELNKHSGKVQEKILNKLHMCIKTIL